jgi:hypothetical protein
MRATYSPSTCGMHHMSLRQVCVPKSSSVLFRRGAAAGFARSLPRVTPPLSVRDRLSIGRARLHNAIVCDDLTCRGSGKPENVAAAQRAFGHRAMMNGLASVEEVAEKTLSVLKACVPAAVPGIAFLPMHQLFTNG